MADIVERMHALYHAACKLEDGESMPSGLIDVLLDAKVEIERLRAASAQQIVQALLSKCDPSNWDADGYEGDEYRIRKEVYDEFHAFAADWQNERP